MAEANSGEQVRLPSDREVRSSKEDTLDFAQYVEALADIIARVDTPFVLAVEGEWGSGKSSLLRLLQERLDAEKHLTVWFNPWKYDGREEVWKALVRGVYARVRQNTSFLRPGWEHTRQVLRKAGIALSKATLETLSQKATGSDTIAQELEALLTLDQTFFNAFEVVFDDLLGQALNVKYTEADLDGGRDEQARRDTRLVVFLDDLDRCSAESVVAVLEAVKLYLDREGCVFVLGVNPAEVSKAVQAKGGGDGHQYLEKIIQLPWTLPRHAEERFEGFLKALGLTDTNCPCGLEEKKDDWLKYVRLVAKVCRNNPRQVKRFVLAACLAARIAPEDLDRLKLAKLIAIHLIAPDFYTLVSWAPESLLRFQEMAHEAEPEDTPPGDLRLRGANQAWDVFRDRDELRQILAADPSLEKGDPKRLFEYSGLGRDPEPDFDELQRRLLSDHTGEMVPAAEVVRASPEPTRSAHVRALRNALVHGAAEVRADAATALGWIGAQEAVEDLRAALRGDAEPNVRAAAAGALGRLNALEASEDLREALTTGETPNVRGIAADALGMLRAAGALDHLLGALRREEHTFVRALSTRALGRIGAQAAIEPLRTTLQSDDAGVVRAWAAAALGELNARHACGDLCVALRRDRDREVRTHAARALGVLGMRDAVGELRTAMRSDRDGTVRRSALHALGAIGAPEAVEDIRQTLADDPDQDVVRASAFALGRIGTAEALEDLRRMLKEDRRPFMRSLAAEALGGLQSPVVVEDVSYVVRQDPDEDLRDWAANLLREVDTPEAREALRGAGYEVEEPPAKEAGE